MGKSRLVAEFVRDARRRGIVVAFGECQSFGTNTSYFVWREIWRRSSGSTRPRRRRAGAERSRRSSPRSTRAGPSRAAAVDAPRSVHPRHELTAAFDAKLRKTSLEDLLVDVPARSRGAEPLVLVLEDCHWIDPLSRDLLEALGRAAAALPVLLVLAYRPSDRSAAGSASRACRISKRSRSASSAPTSRRSSIRAKLAQVLGAEAAARDALVELVSERAEGNPFYIEEL